MTISSTARISSSSIIAPGAVIDAHVNIGPFCIISAGVVIGEGTTIKSHSVINGLTVIGCDNHIGQFSSIGEVNQDLKYKNEPTRLIIGDRNSIGNNATIHRGTEQDNNCTIIGDDNILMNNVHIGHDCIIGNDTNIGDNSGLAGHVALGDGAVVGFMCAIHQFCVLGAYANVAHHSGVTQDIPPFVYASGNYAAPSGIDTASRYFTGPTQEEQNFIQTLYDLLYSKSLSLNEARVMIKEKSGNHPVCELFEWFFKRSIRGIIR
ncbi:acyl-ACP--UDP-N-acetylglucosamine O-acyltransferase [Lelliottia sp. WAP21]|uniref:acyl-ACP--UDP-N-acetylglucosamine O-acyltransferase n=1 Tax=Lelliottia sp. WAP21 TaxID=2877426 RepID=UPI001E2B0C37|nr:acyl-ACP--UDP-N-acetylglucosamine O-acyltransferase [Lelliottia sp. WAP21]